jgi:hypothetical protein
MKMTDEGPETPDERPAVGDYYVVVAQLSTWFVSPEAAARIGAVLDRRWRPRWIKFVDLTGARAWVRTDAIESVSESTEHQRERDRAFQDARRREDDPDRSWDQAE